MATSNTPRRRTIGQLPQEDDTQDVVETVGTPVNEAVELPTAPAPEVPENTRDLSFERLAQQRNNSLLQRDSNRKKLARTYAQEPKVSVMVAPMYIPYFGRVMHVMINGISLAIPCNGKPYDIPETFASEVHLRLRLINEQQQKQKRYADVTANIEGAPGELALY